MLKCPDCGELFERCDGYSRREDTRDSGTDYRCKVCAKTWRRLYAPSATVASRMKS